MMNEERKAMLAAGVAYSIFGLSYLFSKLALNVSDVAVLLCMRFAVTFLLLNVLLLTGVMKLRLRGKNLFYPVCVGLIQPVLYFLLENYGLAHTTTSFTGVISSISPIFTALLGVILLREKPNSRQWLCIGLSIAGVLMVSLGATGGVNTPIGCLSLLGAYTLGSLYSILVRRLSKEYTAFELTYVMFTVAFVFFSVFAFVRHGGGTPALLASALARPTFLAAILYLGGASSVGAYMLCNYSLARLPVTRSTIFNCFATIVSVLSGVIIMRDPFTLTSALSFALILVGVYGVNRFAEG